MERLNLFTMYKNFDKAITMSSLTNVLNNGVSRSAAENTIASTIIIPPIPSPNTVTTAPLNNSVKLISSKLLYCAAYVLIGIVSLILIIAVGYMLFHAYELCRGETCDGPNNEIINDNEIDDEDMSDEGIPNVMGNDRLANQYPIEINEQNGIENANLGGEHPFITISFASGQETDPVTDNKIKFTVLKDPDPTHLNKRMILLWNV